MWSNFIFRFIFINYLDFLWSPILPDYNEKFHMKIEIFLGCMCVICLPCRQSVKLGLLIKNSASASYELKPELESEQGHAERTLDAS